MPPPYQRQRSILYVGQDYALLAALQKSLAALDILVTRHPGDGLSIARLLIGSDIPYEVLLFDESMIGASGEELERFALSLPHRAATPTFIVREGDDVTALAESVRRLLVRARRG